MSHISKEKLIFIHLSSSRLSVATSTRMNFDFAKKPESAQSILRLISRTASGRDLLERFLPQLNRGRIVIQAYPPELVSRLRAVLGEGQPIGAAFVIDGGQGTIYLDLESPLGVLAPFLVHEIIHSLNEGLWKAEKDGIRKADRTELYLRSEEDAFEGQHRFVAELGERYPEFRAFLKAYYPKAKILHEKLTGLDISDLYGFEIGSKDRSQAS